MGKLRFFLTCDITFTGTIKLKTYSLPRSVSLFQKTSSRPLNRPLQTRPAAVPKQPHFGNHLHIKQLNYGSTIPNVHRCCNKDSKNFQVVNAPAILRQFFRHSATTSPRCIQMEKAAAVEAAAEARQRRGKGMAKARRRRGEGASNARQRRGKGVAKARRRCGEGAANAR